MIRDPAIRFLDIVKEKRGLPDYKRCTKHACEFYGIYSGHCYYGEVKIPETEQRGCKVGLNAGTE